MSFWRFFKRLFRKERAPYIEILSDTKIFFKRCGHTGPQKWKLHLWEKDEYFDFNVMEGLVSRGDGFLEKNAFCPECIKDDVIIKSIRCCLCGRHIEPNGAVCLYVVNASLLRNTRKDWLTTFEGRAIGCLRFDCEAADFCGWWTGSGVKLAFED